MSDTVIYLDPSTGRWLKLSRPVQVLRAWTLDEVLPALQEATSAASAGLTAAGFVSYESASAFDEAFKTKAASEFPLVCFWIFDQQNPFDLESLEGRTYNLGQWTPTTSQRQFAESMAEIKKQIACGRTYQVNYTYRLKAPFSGQASSLFFDLLSAQKTATAMFIEWEDYAICSFSPELFFRLAGTCIETRPMKGTAPRGRFLSEDKKRAAWLKNSEKNRAENIMIVDMLRNDLGRIAKTGSVRVKSLFNIERYKTVWQMTSTVTASTGASIGDIFKAMFPCSSITGAPKASTMGIIAELESTPRKIYTGTMGIIGPGRQARFNVAIRTMLIDKKSSGAEYGIGGGIVWDSNVDEEYSETITKARLLFSSPTKFQLLETMLWEKESGYFLLEYHMKRMRDSASYLGFQFPEEQIRKALDRHSPNFLGASKVRLLLAETGKFIIEHSSITPGISKVVRLGIAAIKVDSRNPMLYHKTTERSLYRQALNSRPDCDDVILVNEKNQVTETTIYNIIVPRGHQLVTPAIECGLLPGTFREKLIKEGKIVEALLSPEDLTGDIFLVNSVRKWQRGLLQL